tara:strand:- start:529 stop:744 length:216 start_codon:yes stop_codon:yes gene_type:complete
MNEYNTLLLFEKDKLRNEKKKFIMNYCRDIEYFNAKETDYIKRYKHKKKILLDDAREKYNKFFKEKNILII